MNNSNTDHLSLPDDNMSLSSLPPLPKIGERGSQVCAIIQLYLGIWDELLPAQVAVLQEHIRTCLNCAAVHRQLQQTNRLFANLPATTPSPYVDQAVMATIAARSNEKTVAGPISMTRGNHQSRFYHTRIHIPKVGMRSRSIVGATLAVALGRVTRKKRLASITSIALAAALFLFALMTTVHFMPVSTPQSFAIPAELTWNGYVLYHSETRLDAKGKRYRIDTYHDLATDRIHVETVMLNSLDVVVVGDDHKMLGLDMTHHIAQWGADAWDVDESTFNLTQLRSDIQAKRAVYLDKDTFHEQDVYRIRCRNGLILLLNMNYQPVNVLRGAIGPGTGEPVYDTLQFMPSSHVSNSIWDMSVPEGFRMGTLPPKP